MISLASIMARLCFALILFSASALAQTGTGLTGKYYDTESFGTLVTTRTDATVNFNFASAIPAGSAITAATTYSIAWSGQIEAAYSELYTFTVTADDGARLWVDDQMIVQRTYYQAPGELRGQIRLKAGQRVNVRLEFIQQGGNASVKLEWASASQTKQVVPTNRLYTTTEVPNGGSLMREVWTGLAGGNISTMTSNANYPNKPASRDFITSFECIARDWEDSFGTRVSGFIRPAVSGNYTFTVSGDDVVQLYLSTDATAANKSLIASVASATNFRQWDAQPSQQSSVRALVAGQRYYVELLHKEDSVTDHWSVGWKKPGDAAFSVIPGTVLMMPGTDTAQPATANFFNTLATEQPRLGVSRERFLWLKQQYLSPSASNAKTRAQAVINTATGELTTAVTTGRHAQDRIQRLALAWWITGDNQYAEVAWNNIQNTINNGLWTDPWKGQENGGIAIGYDWLYPYWSQARKDAMVSCMVNKGFNPGWTDSYGNNIGVIINAGHLMAMLAVGTANEAAAEGKMGSAISRLSSRIEKWNSNAGAWYEGTDYGIFTKWDLGQAMPSIECALGSSFGMSRVAGVSYAAREPLTIASNTRQRFTFSDVGTGSHAATGWANWWARRFNALETFDYSRQIGNSPLNALTLPETTTSPSAAGLNPDTAFRGPVDSTNKLFQEVVTLRENWTDSKATFVGGMGGTYYDHGMLQSGTFQLCARGVKWFQDLSSESYDVPNHNTTTPNANGRDRWDYYRNRAEGHNTLVINPGAGPDRIWNAPYASLLNYQSAQNGQRSFAVWDLSKNFTGVTKVQRGIQLLNKRRDVLLQDEIVLPAAGTVWWFAHFTNTSTTASISPDGSSVTLQQGSERLWGKIISGGGVWTVRAAQPLPTSPAPPEAYTNSTSSKLAINLTGVTNTTLAVWFVPLAPGAETPVTTPVISPLSSWNLVADNEAPVASNGSANIAGSAPVDVALSARVIDDWTPSTQMTYVVSAAVGGTVSLLPDGVTARFTPTPGFTGLQSFAFTATDADGATSNTGTMTFSATPVVTNWTSAASGNWSTGTNWQGSTAPVGGPGADIQFFNGQTLAAGTTTATNDLSGITSANKFNFSGTGTATTIVNVAGNALRLLPNGVLSPVITLSGTNTGYRYNIANDITLDDDVTFNASNSGTFVFNGSITGSGGITRIGTFSNLIFAGNNSYAGATNISAGTLQIGNDGATGTLGNGPVSIASGATLRFDRTGSVLVSNDLTGAGRIIVNGATSSDVVSLSGDNDFNGEVRVDNGSLRVTDARQLGSGTKNIVVASSTALLRINGSSAPVIFPSEFSFFTSNPNGAILNEVGDNEILGNLTITAGAGSTRLTVAAGSLAIHRNVTANNTGRALDLRGAGNGIINGNFVDGAGANTIAGFSKNDAGTWTLNGNNSISSTTVVSAGKLIINGSHASGAVSVAAGATLAGRGSLTAATTITGTLAPGDGVGTMNFGSTLSFGAASKLQWEVGSNSLAADQAIATGVISVTSGSKIDLVLNRPGSTANFRLSFWRSSRTWPVAVGSSLSGAFQLGTVSADSAGNSVATYGSFSLQHTASTVNLVWTPIPGFPVIDEPLVTFLQPLANPVVLPNQESTLRITVSAAGAGPITYAWSTVATEESGDGIVTFGNPSSADTTVSISDVGRYVLRCTATNSAISRSADLIVDVGPLADDDFSQAVAVIDPGTAPAAAAGFVANLAGTVSNSTSSVWTVVSGPGTVSFSNAGNPTTPVVFSQSGDYVLRLTAINALGQAWRDLAVTVAAFPTGYEAWQATHWPGVTDLNIIGPNADPDGDGATNIAEFLASTDPKTNTSVPSYVWTEVISGVWSSPFNWTPAVSPTSNALTKLEFLTNITPGGNTASQHDLGGSFMLQRLALNGTGPGTTTISAGTIRFATGGTIDLGNGGLVYDLATPLDITSSTVIQGSPTAETHFSGGFGGVGAFTKNSTGTLVISGSHNLAGAITVTAGSLRVSGAGTSNSAITVRGGTLSITGSGSIAPATGASLTLGGTAVGIFNHDSSATSRFGAIAVGNGNDGAANSIYNQSAGTVQASSLTMNSGFTGGGAGDLNLSGGLLAVSGVATISNQVAGDNVWSTVTISGTGNFTIGGGLRLTGAPAATRNSAGRIVQNAGTVTVAGGLNMARTTATNTAARRGEYNLNGGTLNVNQITQDAGTDTFGAFNFNGGTLKPTAASTTFMQGLTTAEVKTGGANIDSNGFDITIAQPLLTGGAGDGGLTKSGAGMLTLTGASTYTGATTITSGRLALSGSLTSAITATAGTLAAPGTPSTSGNVSIASGGRYEVRPNDTLTVGGSVTLAGNLDIIAASGLPNGTSWRILNKTSAGAVSGTFASKPQGAIFGASGYSWLISYTGGDGNDVTVTMQVALTPIEQWRLQYFGASANSGNAADLFDANKDGEGNLLEFATGQNPTAPTKAATNVVKNGGGLEFTYTRSKAAMADGVTFTVEWIDTLATGSWSNAGVTEQILTDNGTLRTVRASVAAASGGRRFLRLKVSK
jgi:autotransporter-associated beta strand protein